MSSGRPNRHTVDQPWKRIALNFSHLSTSISLDSTPDPSIPVAWPSTPHLGESQNSPFCLKIKFRVKATAAFGSAIAVVGSTQELGMWDLSRKITLETRPGEYPIWSSEELCIPVGSKTCTVEYKYVYIERVTPTQTGTCSWEKRIPNRRLDLHFSFTDQLTWTVQDSFEERSVHVIEPKARLPLLSSLADEGSVYDHLQVLCGYFEGRGRDATLMDYLAAAHLFRYWASKGKETESKQSLDLMLRLSETLLSYMTPEIEPIVRDIIEGMEKCSIPFWKVSHSVLDRDLVESGDVPLGCKSEELFEFLTDFLNVSEGSDTTARTVVLNSVRRCLRKLRASSSTPDLLFLYDNCLSYAENKYTADFHPDSTRLLTALHRVTIILDALELSSICALEARQLSHALNDVWHSERDLHGHMEPIKGLLVEATMTIVRWSARYANAEVAPGEGDILGLKDLLGQIGRKAVRGLFPTLTHAMRLVDAAMLVPHYYPINPRTAEGKVVKLGSIMELPTVASPLIAIVSDVSQWRKALPDTLKAVIVVQDVDLSSKFVSQCLAQQIGLAVVSPDRIPSNVESRSQVHIFEDSLDFV